MSLFDLFNEIKCGNLSQVKEILKSKPNLANQYLYGVTPMLYSIECNREDIALFLCTNFSSNLNLVDNLGASPLERAIETQSYKLVEEIIKKMKKTDLDDLFFDDETLLTSSLKSDDQMVSIVLINGGIDINKPNKVKEFPLELAIRFNKIDALRSMLNRKDICLDSLENEYCPLLDACEKDLTEIAIMLIECGADVNVCDNDQEWTPLMHSICNNNELIAAKLIEKRADLNACDFNGNSAVHLAVLNDNDFILSLLLKNNADKNTLNIENMSPLDLAKINESEECVKLLS